MTVTKEQAQEAYKKCGTYTAAAKSLGVHRTIISRLIRGCYYEGNGPSAVASSVVEPDGYTTHSAIRRRLEAERTMRRQVEEAFETYRAAHDFIEGLGEGYNAAEATIITPRVSKRTSESMSVLFNADWHAFEQVKKEEVNGLNEYTPTICRDSVETASCFFVKQTDACRNITTINDALVCYLGDLMSGQLWPDQIEGNAGSPLEEAVFVVDLIISQLTYILAQGSFKNVHVYTVDGNHSRITEKKRKANRAHHSLEWLIFQFVQRHFEKVGEKRIHFNIGVSIHNYIEMMYGVDTRHPNGLVWRLTHGDEGITYRGGVGGISVPANRQIRLWNEGRKADLTAFGHLHTQEPNLRNYLAVGTTMGMSPNGLRYGYEPPTQAMLTVEKQKGITGYYPIYVR